jgi:hypothetical protein
MNATVICQVICPWSALLFVLLSATLFVIDSHLLTQ